MSNISKKRPSIQSESETDSADDGRPRRKRLHRASASPGPPLKRKSTSAGTTQAPPSKKKKATSVIGTDDPTRRYCLGKLEDILRDVFIRYPHVPLTDEAEEEGQAVKLVEKARAELTDKEKIQLSEQANRFATELEQCIYDIYSEPDKQGEPHAGGKYKYVIIDSNKMVVVINYCVQGSFPDVAVQLKQG
jgi:hypothetical protein